MNNTKSDTISEENIEHLRKLTDSKIETDEDYQRLGELFDEHE
jgi:hypothetical protein